MYIITKYVCFYYNFIYFYTFHTHNTTNLNSFSILGCTSKDLLITFPTQATHPTRFLINQSQFFINFTRKNNNFKVTKTVATY